MNQQTIIPDITSLPNLPDPLPLSSHKPSLTALPQSYLDAIISIRTKLPKNLRTPSIAIICYNGLEGLVDVSEKDEERIEVGFEDVEGLAGLETGEGRGKFIFGRVGKEVTERKSIVFLLGRINFYSGASFDQIIYPVRILKLLGVSKLIATSTSSTLATNGEAGIGNIVVVQDHISLANLTSTNPLVGGNRETFGPRFPSLFDAYDFELRKLAFRAAYDLHFEKGVLREGVYAYISGPTFETRAEAQFLRSLGANICGMSTIPEVIAARHAGIKVLSLSLITSNSNFTPHRSAEAAVASERSGISSILEGGFESLEKSGVDLDKALDSAIEGSGLVMKLVRKVVEDFDSLRAMIWRDWREKLFALLSWLF